MKVQILMAGSSATMGNDEPNPVAMEYEDMIRNKTVADYCVWKKGYNQFEDEVYWDTSCDNAFQFEDGSPTDNGFKYCPYCGRKLKEEK